MTEKNVLARGKSVCADHAAQMAGLGIAMHADAAEIRGEGRLHRLAGFMAQRLSTTAFARNRRLDGGRNFVLCVGSVRRNSASQHGRRSHTLADTWRVADRIWFRGQGGKHERTLTENIYAFAANRAAQIQNIIGAYT